MIPKSFQLRPDGRKIAEDDIWDGFNAKGMKFFTKVPYSSSDYDAWLTVLLQIPGLIIKPFVKLNLSHGSKNRKEIKRGFNVSYQNDGHIHKICTIYEGLSGVQYKYGWPDDYQGDRKKYYYDPPFYVAEINGYGSGIDSSIYHQALGYESNREYIQGLFNKRKKTLQK